MRAYSASQAVSPAIDRTRSYLFHPFEISTYLKMATIACLSEGFAANFSFATGRRLATEVGPYSSFHISDEMIMVFGLAILACLAVGIIAFYLVACIRFAFFHCLVYQTKEIRPAWSRYRPQAIRFFNAGLVVWIIFAAISTAIVFPFAFNLYKLLRLNGMRFHYNFDDLFLLFVPLLVLVPILALIAFAVDVVLHDFMLPHMALENAPFGAAWKAARTRIAAQKGSFVLFCFLRAALPLLALLALLIVVGIPLLIIFGVLTTSASGFLDLLEDTTPLGVVFHWIFEILFGVIGMGIGVFVEFGLGGPIATWVRNYALLYYGGRYKTLGDILSPPSPVTDAAQAIA